MRLTGIVVAVLLGTALTVGVATGGKPPAAPAPAAPAPTLTARVSRLGLEGIREIYVQVDWFGDEKWRALVGMTKEEVKAQVEERVSRIAGLRVLEKQSTSKPRLILQVVGHVNPGYDEKDPPTATNFMLAVSQPVTLNRRGRDGRPITTNGITDITNLLTTRRASATGETVKQKIAYLLDGFEREYLAENPPPAAGGD